MRALITPGRRLAGAVEVPGDKSIAHRWLILAATGVGRSELAHLPPSLDVRATATCLGVLTPSARGALEAWARAAASQAEGHGSTWNTARVREGIAPLEVEGEGRGGLVEPGPTLACENSGTTMRLLTGLLASLPFESRLSGDGSLLARPMERVAEPLRLMGADVRTSDGRPPIRVLGTSGLRGIDYAMPVPTAQVKGAVLLAGLAADGPTTVREPAATRDHTERVLHALGAPIVTEERSVSVERFQHDGFRGRVPGDVSSAAFLIAAAGLTGSELVIDRVGLNPTRLAFLEVLDRMGIRTEIEVEGEELGEPVGSIRVAPSTGLAGTTVVAAELPLVIDEVPVLAAVAAAARGESWFEGAGELRTKESDRLSGIAAGIRGLGGHVGDEGDDLVVAGGGLRGGRAHAGGDHRLAMAFAVVALAAASRCEVEGIESADVSFPGFVPTLRALGAEIEVEG